MNIEICMGSSCFARGNSKNLELIEHFAENHTHSLDIHLKGSCCINACTKGPTIKIDGESYHNVDRETLIDILNRYLAAEA